MSLIRSEGSGDVDLGFYNGVTSRSAMFNDGDSDHLKFTPGSASSAVDRRKVTHSVWLKRTALSVNTSAASTIYSTTQNGVSDYYQYRFSDDDKITLILDVNDEYEYVKAIAITDIALFSLHPKIEARRIRP